MTDVISPTLVDQAQLPNVNERYLARLRKAIVDANAAWAAAGGGSVPSTRAINTTAPLTGGGDMSADRTFSIPAATTLASGYLTAADWTTFNGKQAALGFTPYNATNPAGYTSNVGTVTGVTGTAPVVSSGGVSPAISMAQATSLVDGYLKAADWTAFNGKQAASANLAAWSAIATSTKESAVTAGTTAQFWRGDKSFTDFATTVRASVLTGLSLATATVVAATDSVLVAIGKLQAQITALSGSATFTPTVIGTTTAGIGTYNSQIGTYKRIGNIVFFKLNVDISAHTGTGNIRISGLPVTAAADAVNCAVSVGLVGGLSVTAGDGAITADVMASTTQIRLLQITPTTIGAGGIAMDTVFQIALAGFYFV